MAVMVDSHIESFNQMEISDSFGYFNGEDDAVVLTTYKWKFNELTSDFDNGGSATIAFNKKDIETFIDILIAYKDRLR